MSKNSRKVVVVTGASGGLGRPIAETLADAGYSVYAQYRTESGELHASGDRHGYRRYCADLTSEHETRGFASHVVGPDGQVPWAIVNLAGGSKNAISWKFSADDFLGVLEQNVVTAHSVCRAFVPDMRIMGRGRIVNVSSIVAETGAAGAAHYAAAKAAVIGYTKSLALELAPKGITANVVSPGYFDAGLIRDVGPEHVSKIIERIPLGRLGRSADELASVVAFLLREESSYVTGAVINVNGGLR